jgi:hypothetical protein
MDIETLSMNMAQDRLRQEAALKVQGMILRDIRGESAALAKLMESAVVTDPNLGRLLDFPA